MRYVVAALMALAVTSPPARAVDKEAIKDAIDRGVAALKKMQGENGTWAHAEIGATALAALTLIECGVPKTDKAVTRAAEKVRESIINAKETYSISLSIMFLDRLDDPNDTPLIESLIVRLLAGQQASGGWGYHCPTISDDEVKRIKGEMDGTRVLQGGRDLKKLAAKGKRKSDDLPKEILAQLKVVGAGGMGKAGFIMGSVDNSNTQFATLALWIGRRYGIPTHGGMIKLYDYFMRSQNPDGGWTYIQSPAALKAMPQMAPMMKGMMGSTAAMTCAGLMGMAVGHGAALDIKKAKGEKIDKQDLSKDQVMKNGLAVLGTAIGVPLGWDGKGARPAALPSAAGKSYYFFWSLERVAIILNLKTIGKKDWYTWGAEVLLANQRADGSWAGEYAASGADTCFALLFLKRSNLAEDLSNAITGLTDPGERQLKAGGVGGAGLRGASRLTPAGLGEKKAGSGSGETKPPSRLRPPVRTAEEKAAFKLADDLIKAKSEARADLLKKLRDTRGGAYTDALVHAIGELDLTGRRQARVALAERFTRLKGTTLREYLKDKESEVRLAAVKAIAEKELKELCPDLILRLADDDGEVARVARAALKELSGGKDFGPRPGATAAQRKQAIADWQAWWKKQARE